MSNVKFARVHLFLNHITPRFSHEDITNLVDTYHACHGGRETDLAQFGYGPR